MRIHIDDDFDLNKIAASGQCFRFTQEDDGSYRIISGGRCLYAAQTGENEFGLECNRSEFDQYWRAYFDLDLSYRAIRERVSSKDDPFLAAAADDQKGVRILRQDPFEMLITSILTQNKNIPAICRSVELLAEAAGEAKTDSRGKLFHAFPQPEAIAAMTEEELKRCRLGYRSGYVKAAAGAVLSGELDLESLMTADDERTMKALTSIYGVGSKVASCVSLFGLHHLDAFPLDVWIRRVLDNEYPNGYPFETYSPYNGIYQQYMFAYYRNEFPTLMISPKRPQRTKG